MRLKAQELTNAALKWYTSLSPREKFFVIAATAVVVVWTSVRVIYEPLVAAFTTQREMLAELEGEFGTMSNVNVLLDRYSRLIARKTEIEAAYKSVQNWDMNETSHIEDLVKRVAGVQAQPAISTTGTTPLGDQYETASFAIRFQTSNLPKLIEFLFELAYGKRPLILSKLSLNKRPSINALDVELEVSSLRPISK